MMMRLACQTTAGEAEAGPRPNTMVTREVYQNPESCAIRGFGTGFGLSHRNQSSFAGGEMAVRQNVEWRPEGCNPPGLVGGEVPRNVDQAVNLFKTKCLPKQKPSKKRKVQVVDPSAVTSALTELGKKHGIPEDYRNKNDPRSHIIQISNRAPWENVAMQLALLPKASKEVQKAVRLINKYPEQVVILASALGDDRIVNNGLAQIPHAFLHAPLEANIRRLTYVAPGHMPQRTSREAEPDEGNDVEGSDVDDENDDDASEVPDNDNDEDASEVDDDENDDDGSQVEGDDHDVPVCAHSGTPPPATSKRCPFRIADFDRQAANMQTGDNAAATVIGMFEDGCWESLDTGENKCCPLGMLDKDGLQVLRPQRALLIGLSKGYMYSLVLQQEQRQETFRSRNALCTASGKYNFSASRTFAELKGELGISSSTSASIIEQAVAMAAARIKQRSEAP